MPLFGEPDARPDARPEALEVAGRPLHCRGCHHTTFWRRSAQLHGGMATFRHLARAAATAACLVCSRGGYIHWFPPVDQ